MYEIHVLVTFCVYSTAMFTGFSFLFSFGWGMSLGFIYMDLRVVNNLSEFQSPYDLKQFSAIKLIRTLLCGINY